MSFTTDAARWRALSIRDPTADGQFVYSVKSTNIYCRPTCPARLARRANVGFFKTALEAEAAGFRACKRCKPDMETNEDPQVKAVGKACALIEDALRQNDAKALKLQDLAKNVGLTPRYFHKIFKQKTGFTPKEYAKVQMEEQRNSGSLAAMSEPGPVDMTPFNIETFDFNDLVDFNADASPPLEESSPLVAMEPCTQGTFGHEIDVNIQTPATTSAPDAIDAGLGTGGDKLFRWIDAASISDVTMMATSATFELDAAFVLSGEAIPWLNESMFEFAV